MNKIVIILWVLSAGLAFAEQDAIGNKIKKMQWGGIEVVWMEDERFPTYDLAFYFSDGAMSDSPGKSGETQMMFDSLTAGTNRYNQKQINDSLEFFGVQLGVNVTHEHSTVAFSGLAKDLIPTLKMVCHLFNESVFPEKELTNLKQRKKNAFHNLVTNHSALADRASRMIALEKTPYALPAEGKLSDLSHLRSKDLNQKLKYFNQMVKKRVYFSGGGNILHAIKNLVVEECAWGEAPGSYVRLGGPQKSPSKGQGESGPELILVTVPDANQVQIRIGRFLSSSEIKNPDLMMLSSNFLGGGFTSLLMQELRVKRGLTYSAGALAAPQKEYGRAVISTFTKNPTLELTLNVIKDILQKAAAGEFSEEDFLKSVNHLSGNYLFRFEDNSAYLSQLLYYDHLDRNFVELYQFPQTIKSFRKQDVAENIKQIFSWEKQKVVVVGDKSLLPILKKLGKVEVFPYGHFL